MKTFKNGNTLFSLAALIALSACGGGGGGGDKSAPVTAAPGTTVSGKAVDGYLSGATIFCDANGDRVVNAGETAATTDGNGNFTLASSCSHTIVATGGIDTDTGYAFTGLLSAPAGSTVVSPITTLLANSTISNDELLAALNLPAGFDLTQTDPMTDFALWRKNLAVQQILQQVTYFFTSYVTPRSALYQQAAQSLVQAMLESNRPLFNASSAVDQVILTSTLQTMAAGLSVSLSNADITAAVQTLAQQATDYLVASNGTTLVNVAKNLQNPSRPPIQTPSTQTNYLALTNDTFHINGQPFTLSQLSAPGGITSSGLDTMQFQYTEHGTVNLNQFVNVGASISEVGGSGRILQLKVENLRIEREHDTGAIIASPTPDTIVYAYMRDQNGIEVNDTLDGSNLNVVSASVNSLTINYADLINKVATHPNVPASFNADQFLNIRGSFQVKAVVTHNLNARRANGDTLTTLNMGIYRTKFGVSGYGVEGRIHIQ